MPLSTLLLTVGGYVVVAVLLLSLNLRSRWRWWIKAGGIVVTTALFVGTYFAVGDMLGWATSAKMPQRFQLIWSKITMPDEEHSRAGFIYMWVEELDKDNLPSGRPRAFQIPYFKPLADKAEEAQQKIEDGEEVMGNMEEMTDEEMAEMQALMEQQVRDGLFAADMMPFMELDMELGFDDLPPATLPDKGPMI